MNIAKPPLMNITKPPIKPFLVVLAYWEGDHADCYDVANLMVELQEKHAGKAVKIWLLRRQDCPRDDGMLKVLRSKFDVDDVRASSPLRGYPGGANGMFGTTAIHISNNNQQYDGWLWMEADCVPMRPSWWKDLQDEWLVRPNGIHVVGWKGDCNGDGTGWHITGCAIYDQQIARMIPCVSMCDSVPWDYQCRGKILEVGKETPLIHLCWRARDAKPDILKKKWALCHGYKDGSLRKLVREKVVSKK